MVKEIWRAASGDNWICCEVVGSSGGILVMWNKGVLIKKDQWVGTFLAFVLLEEASSNNTWIVTSVYGPNDSSLRDSFWSELDSNRNRWSNPWCIGGD